MVSFATIAGGGEVKSLGPHRVCKYYSSTKGGLKPPVCQFLKCLKDLKVLYSLQPPQRYSSGFLKYCQVLMKISPSNTCITLEFADRRIKYNCSCISC